MWRQNRRLPRVLLAILLFSIATAAGVADQLVLTNGNTLEGIVTRQEDGYKVEFPTGHMVIESDAVRTIIRSETTLEQYRKRRDRLDQEDPEAHFRLGRWAETNGLHRQARTEFRHTIALDPDHEEARRALGYRKYEGEWMTGEEIKREKGFVKYEGEWVTPEVKQARIRLAEKRRLERERESARMERLKQDLERSRRQNDRLERELEQSRRRSYRRYGSSYYDRYPWYGGRIYLGTGGLFGGFHHGFFRFRKHGKHGKHKKHKKHRKHSKKHHRFKRRHHQSRKKHHRFKRRRHRSGKRHNRSRKERSHHRGHIDSGESHHRPDGDQ